MRLFYVEIYCVLYLIMLCKKRQLGIMLNAHANLLKSKFIGNNGKGDVAFDLKPSKMGCKFLFDFSLFRYVFLVLILCSICIQRFVPFSFHSFAHFRWFLWRTKPKHFLFLFSLPRRKFNTEFHSLLVYFILPMLPSRCYYYI